MKDLESDGPRSRMWSTRARAALRATTLATGIAGCGGGLLGGTPAPDYRGPASSHFDGKQFFNPEGEQGDPGGEGRGPKEFLEMITARRYWPKSLPVQTTVPDAQVQGDGLRVTWIGHSTTLLQTRGFNILIDPMWAHFDSPVQMLVRPRVRAPGVQLERLPKIDLVLISHTHLDHLDTKALKFVYDRDRPAIIGGFGIDALLQRDGIPARGGDWNERISVRPGLDILLNRAHHWSGRGLHDKDLVLWTGFTILLPGGECLLCRRHRSGEDAMGERGGSRGTHQAGDPSHRSQLHQNSAIPLPHHGSKRGRGLRAAEDPLRAWRSLGYVRDVGRAGEWSPRNVARCDEVPGSAR